MEFGSYKTSDGMFHVPNPTTPVDPCLLQNFSEQLAVAIAEAEGDDDDEGEGGAAEDTADTTIGEREMDDHDDEDAMYGPNNDPPMYEVHEEIDDNYTGDEDDETEDSGTDHGSLDTFECLLCEEGEDEDEY